MTDQKSLRDSLQSTDTWYFAIAKMNTWVKNDEGEITRPYLKIIVNLDLDIIQDARIGEQPNEIEASAFLLTAMTKSPHGLDIPPHRPARVFFEDRSLAQSLSSELQQLEIESKYRPQTEILDEVLEDILSKMNKDHPQLPGLLSIKKVNPKIIERFFKAAAAFYRAAPWVQLSNHDILSIQIAPQEEPYYLIVMGQGGIEYGLSLYLSWEDLEWQFTDRDHPADILPPNGYHTLNFEDITGVPFDDLDAIETYGWEIAGEQAYPAPFNFTPDREVKRPDREMLLWYEAALWAIPIFVEKHISRNALEEIEPVEANIPVKSAAGNVNVQINVLKDDLPKTWQTPPMEFSEEEQTGVLFDPRVMEMDLFKMSGMFSDNEPNLVEAQRLMYKAWEEQNPAKRIIMAREALKISSDCADAYVLLAEEQASTLEEALAYYQSGVEAGERALGSDYFEENIGHFWGLLETRPYMRSLEGLARCLWKSGRKVDALDYYNELLRLNPGDNQGIRYVLIDLLLLVNRLTEVEELIQQYEDEDSAVWLYTQALLSYRNNGDKPVARRSLKAAWKQNPLVPDYLTGKKRVPNRLPNYTGYGDDNEAVVYAADHLNYWRRTPGAVDWIRKELMSPSSKKTGKRR